MTNISADIAATLTPVAGQQLADIIITEPLPWYVVLWIISIIGGLLIIPTIVVAGRIARKHSRPLQTYRMVLQFVIITILGIGSVNCLLGIAELLANAALVPLSPSATSMLFLNLAQPLKLLSASIGLATIGGITLITINEIRKD